MGLVANYWIECDAEDDDRSPDCETDATGDDATPAEARKQAELGGWTQVKGKWYCPMCVMWQQSRKGK
jgi:rubredoxin